MERKACDNQGSISFRFLCVCLNVIFTIKLKLSKDMIVSNQIWLNTVLSRSFFRKKVSLAYKLFELKNGGQRILRN